MLLPVIATNCNNLLKNPVLCGYLFLLLYDDIKSIVLKAQPTQRPFKLFIDLDLLIDFVQDL